MTSPHSRFEEHGWLVLKGIFTPKEVQRLTEAYDTLIAPNMSQPSTTDVVQLTQPRLRHETFTKNLQHPALWKTVKKALNWNEAQLLQDVLLYRTGPSSGRVEWHCDHTYTAFLHPPRLASVRVALTHSGPDSGCLQVVDGSHRFDHARTSNIFGTSIEQGGLTSFAKGQTVQVEPIELEPGDVSIHHSKTLHASFENHTDEPQKIIVHHIFDGRCTLDSDKLPSPQARAHFPVDSTGHLDRRHFPLLG